jgi:hypothetical protein
MRRRVKNLMEGPLMVVATSVDAAVGRTFGSNSEREVKGMRGWCAGFGLDTPGVVAKAAKTHQKVKVKAVASNQYGAKRHV